jgi:hypothetical protein
MRCQVARGLFFLLSAEQGRLRQLFMDNAITDRYINRCLQCVSKSLTGVGSTDIYEFLLTRPGVLPRVSAMVVAGDRPELVAVSTSPVPPSEADCAAVRSNDEDMALRCALAGLNYVHQPGSAFCSLLSFGIPTELIYAACSGRLYQTTEHVAGV